MKLCEHSSKLKQAFQSLETPIFQLKIGVFSFDQVLLQLTEGRASPTKPVLRFFYEEANGLNPEALRASFVTLQAN